MSGHFIVVEGPDGSGKTTLVADLVDRLKDAGHHVVPVREPGGTPSAEILRELVLTDSGHAWTDAAELFLILAARAELVETVIRPAIESGAVVVSDRFGLSTVAYQAIGRGLPREQVSAALGLATGGLEPHVTLILDVDAAVGRDRQAEAGKSPDRIEQAAVDLHQRVATYYAGVEGADVVHLDAHRDAESVADEAWVHVSAYLAEQPSSTQG